ncbi:MAG TPA: family 1 glycosylhydrolase [Gemmatimonadaceae bacterium]|nr:family 1 glycosylhydrolase [Gemmatimonadaceae bacterium]
MRYYQPRKLLNPSTQRFLFATGIECSYPTIEWKGGRVRQDELRKCGHYERWREDFDCAQELGVGLLRYGPPYYTMHTAPGKYDWDWTDEVLPTLQKTGIIAAIDLCHFGVPDWIGDFQNPDFPALFADYARAFAERYPWVRFYTPVNEMYIAAEFSGYYGWWNERLTTHRGFVTALKHLVRANVLAMISILEVRPDALFIQSESSEYTHASRPEFIDECEMLNDRRFLSLDLNYGVRVNSSMYDYLLDNGLTEEEYTFFMQHNLREHCILGNDYYAANEHLMVSEHERVFAGDVFGYYVLTLDYYRRYNLPVMHTETNQKEPDSTRWLWKTWANVQRLRHDGVPLCGMTWYSLIDQVDWDTALRENNGRVNALGLYDMDRNIRPVGEAYRTLISQWHNLPLLPNGPFSYGGVTDGATAPELQWPAEPSRVPPSHVGP